MREDELPNEPESDSHIPGRPVPMTVFDSITCGPDVRVPVRNVSEVTSAFWDTPRRSTSSPFASHDRIPRGRISMPSPVAPPAVMPLRAEMREIPHPPAPRVPVATTDRTMPRVPSGTVPVAENVVMTPPGAEFDVDTFMAAP